MGTFSQIDTIIQERSTYDGDEFADRRKRAINWAIREICSVRFWFLYKAGTPFSTTVSDRIYALPTNFLHEWKFWITDGSGVKRELQPGTVEDIMHLPPADADVPKYFQVAGSTTVDSAVVPAVYIGSPTTNGVYAVDFGYFHIPDDLVNDGDISIVSSLYKRDDPIVNGALFKLYDDVNDEEKSQSAYNKFIISMRVMENTMRFEGAEYADLLQEGAKAEESKP